MKKQAKSLRHHLLSALTILALGASTLSLAACSSDDDDNSGNSNNASEYILGKKWAFDGNKDTKFSFYRNHLVVCDGGIKVSSGMLTPNEALFLGTWQINNNKLTTTFTSGTNTGFDWNSILYGTMNIKSVESNNSVIYFTDNDKKEHDLMYLSSYSQNNTFTDYTDDTAHDKALHGTWHMQAYVNNEPANATMIINKDGSARFLIDIIGSDIPATYTTKNGRVTFSNYIFENTSTKSFIYIREDNRILLYSEGNARLLWKWNNE